MSKVEARLTSPIRRVGLAGDPDNAWSGFDQELQSC